uniref:Non-structural protein 3 n=1 Tax=Rotavirus B TaxID=28876 RepID=A0A2H4ZSG5_9REOV|nr:non-structural protein 3 [Rotavirus B]AUG44875.1 non-structural protein 3 [Rotavirus B]AUG44876.1 non-structural protein 3 [Rotavirus B]AUG44878.1 non-structural protein 3 [Rotavirus B]AUG44879.1 non-structural protein 3 [Rotavirus B]
MALNVIVSVLESVLHKLHIEKFNEVTAEFKEALHDCGIRVDDWRDAFYNERIPKPMSSTSMAIQLKNFELEVLQLRNKAWLEGADRKSRLFSSFDISSKNGHTVLMPKTRNAQLMLANSVADLKIRNGSSEIIDDLIKKNEELTRQLSQFTAATENPRELQITYKIEAANAKLTELSDLLKVCQNECIKLQKRLAFQEEQTEDRLTAVNAHHAEEKEIMRREIERLNTVNVCMNEYNNVLEKQHARNLKIIRGLAIRANLLVDDSDEEVETDNVKQKKDA